MNLSRALTLHAAGVLTEEEALLLLSSRQEPLPTVPRRFTYGERFNINALNDHETRFYFRFWKRDLYQLYECLGLSEQYVLPNRSVVSGFEGLCILLRRMADPGRYGDLSSLFGRHPTVICMAFNLMVRVVYDKFSVLLSIESGVVAGSKRERHAAAIAGRGAPVSKCIGLSTVQ